VKGIAGELRAWSVLKSLIFPSHLYQFADTPYFLRASRRASAPERMTVARLQLELRHAGALYAE
jgi:hypothetical protein